MSKNNFSLGTHGLNLFLNHLLLEFHNLDKLNTIFAICDHVKLTFYGLDLLHLLL
jgi:hypothetical protein